MFCKLKLCGYYCNFIKKIQELTKGRSLYDEYLNAKRSQQQTGFENFARQLAMAIAAILKNNLDLIESTSNQMEANADVLLLRECVDLGLQYLLQLTSVEEEELFKICLELWHWFSNNVMIKLRGDQAS